jgi:mRNA-degrading endonuclease RelE of RelBE toxin-antitoxin system
LKPVELPAAFRKLLRHLSKQERQKIGLALREVEQAYGQPHRHRSLGLRDLPKGCVEVRVG